MAIPQRILLDPHPGGPAEFEQDGQILVVLFIAEDISLDQGAPLRRLFRTRGQQKPGRQR